MNAAARVFNNGILSRGWAVSIFLARAQISVILLVITLLTTALSVVYVTNMSRSYHTSLQQSLVESDQLHVQWSQLLLERSTWMMQARVQQVAQEKLNMEFPSEKSTVIINP